MESGVETIRAACLIYTQCLLLVMNRGYLGISARASTKGQILPLSVKSGAPGFPGQCHPAGSLFLCVSRGGAAMSSARCPGTCVASALVLSVQSCTSFLGPGSCPKWTISFRSRSPVTILNLLTYVPINYWYSLALFRLVSADGYIITRQTFARQADR